MPRETEPSTKLTLVDEFLRSMVKQGPLVVILSLLVYFTGVKIVFPLIDQSVITMRAQDDVLKSQATTLAQIKNVVDSLHECAKRQESQITTFADVASKEKDFFSEVSKIHEKQLSCLERIDTKLSKPPPN